MFEWLAAYSKIIVTGPHRAGTRIGARMIAEDTGHTFIDEYDIAMDNLLRMLSVLRSREGIVIQCPSLCRYAHMFAADDTAVVLMRRPVAEIVASQARVRWTGEKLELLRYDRTDGVIAEVKYAFWDGYQKPRIKHAVEISYASLAEHPLWLDKDTRSVFWTMQTSPDAVIEVLSDDIRPQAWGRIMMLDDELRDFDAMLIKSAGPMKGINETGKVIWQHCDGAHTVGEILHVLQTHFPEVNEATLRQDMTAFLVGLSEESYVQFRRGTTQVHFLDSAKRSTDFAEHDADRQP